MRRTQPFRSSLCPPTTFTFQLYFVYSVYIVKATALADNISNEIERA